MPVVHYFESSVFTAALNALSVERRQLMFIGIQQILAKHGAELEGTKWLKYLGGELWELRLGPTVSNVLLMAGLEFRSSLIDSDLLLRVFLAFSDSGSAFVLLVFDKTDNRLRSKQKEAINQAQKLLVLLHNKTRVEP